MLQTVLLFIAHFLMSNNEKLIALNSGRTSCLSLGWFQEKSTETLLTGEALVIIIILYYNLY